MHSPFQLMFAPCYFFAPGYMLFGLNLTVKRTCIHVKSTNYVAMSCQKDIFPLTSVLFNCWSEFSELIQCYWGEKYTTFVESFDWFFFSFNLKRNNSDKILWYSIVLLQVWLLCFNFLILEHILSIPSIATDCVSASCFPRLPQDR